MTFPGELRLDELSGPQAAAALARLRARSPVAWVPALNGWLVTSHPLALTVMHDAPTYTVDHPGFSTAQVVGPSMLSLDGPEHLRHRKPFGHAFRASKVQERFSTTTSDLAGNLVARIRPRGEADLRAALAGPLSANIAAQALGLQSVEVPTVLRWYAAIVGAVTDITAGLPARPEAASAMADLTEAVQTTLATRCGGLLTAATPALTPSEVTSNAAVLMFGGIDTTEGMITNALLHVLSDPELTTAVREDHELIGPVIEESLRLEPAASVIDRYATTDVELGGAPIGTGDLVRVSLSAANRDPLVFTDPDRYDLSRSNLDQQIAFARGPHSCIAMELARLETRAALATVLEQLPGVHMSEAAEVTGLVFRKPQDLNVKWHTTADGRAPGHLQ